MHFGLFCCNINTVECVFLRILVLVYYNFTSCQHVLLFLDLVLSLLCSKGLASRRNILSGSLPIDRFALMSAKTPPNSKLIWTLS